MHTLRAQSCNITSFPHTEDFTSTNSSLGCWTIINGGDANTWVFSNDEASIAYGSTAHDDYLITPQWSIYP